MRALDESFAYFNSGKESGQLSAHKHVHVAPLESLPEKCIPIDVGVREELKKKEQANYDTLANINQQQREQPQQIFYKQFMIEESTNQANRAQTRRKQSMNEMKNTSFIEALDSSAFNH